MAILSEGIISLNSTCTKTAINAHPELAEEIIDKFPISTITSSPEPGITIYTFDPKVATLSIKHDANAHTLEFKGHDLAVRHMILTKTPLLDREPWQEKKPTLVKLTTQFSQPLIPSLIDNNLKKVKRPRKQPKPPQPLSTFNYDTPPAPKKTDTNYCNLHPFHPANTCSATMPNRLQEDKNASSSSTDRHSVPITVMAASHSDEKEMINSKPNTQILHNTGRMIQHLRKFLTPACQNDPPIKYQAQIKVQNKQYLIEFS